MRAYAILTNKGFYTSNREVRPLGPPKLYTTEKSALRSLKNNAGTQLEGGAVVAVDLQWRYIL